MDFDDYKDDLSEVIEDCRSKEVSVIITNGVHKEGNRKTLELCKKYDILKPAYGFYPVHCAEFSEEEFDKEIEWIKQQKPIAIGEVGLDYFIGDDNPDGDLYKEIQIKCFKKMIALAEELDIPIIVHSRKAEADCINILEESGYKKVVMHCFSGKKKLVKKGVELGFYFSIPANIDRALHFQMIVNQAPITQLLTETDAPYLSPNPGERNTPAHVISTVKKIAELKGFTEDETKKALYMNYKKLFE